ncbi:MAG TPA: glutamate racemase [Kofleriaceae bacterium]|nr:glutamate racemase [Kofleriaceae bacterium]
MSAGAGRRPIGVFDSGMGGLTVVRAVRAALPGEDILYLGDTARVPYGSKSPRTVERYSLACQRFLLDRGVKLVLVACNTASANALPALAAASPVPVIGAVEPGAQSALAASARGRIGVIGTLATIGSRAYEGAILARSPSARVVGLACPLLVPLAEEGWTHGPIAGLVARRYLSELFTLDPDLDTIVLGCTHYPLLAEELAAAAAELAGRAIAVVDSATAMAEAARAALFGEAGSPAPPPAGGRGQLGVFVTDATRMEELAPRFLGEGLQRFELVDL